MKFEELYVGQVEEIVRTIGEDDLKAFVDLTGDDNPLHVDESYSLKTPLKKRVVHGMLGASFISTLIGTRLPGEGALWTSQTLNFIAPIRVGDTIRVRGTVQSVTPSERAATMEIVVYNQSGREVITGRGTVKMLETQERQTESRLPGGIGAALVTGASRGFGAAIALRLALDGYKTVVNYRRNQREAEAIAARIVKAGGEAMAFQADVRDPEEIDRMTNAVLGRFGKIDVLVNNAAGSLNPGPFEALQWEAVQSQIDVHLKAVFHTCKSILPGMVERKTGSVINVLTVAVDGVPPPGMHAYVAAKSALRGLTRTLALEYAPKGVRINAVSPGLAETDLTADLSLKSKKIVAAQTPARRLARPEDVANAVAFLAGDGAEYLCGETIRVAGGAVML